MFFSSNVFFFKFHNENKDIFSRILVPVAYVVQNGCDPKKATGGSHPPSLLVILSGSPCHH